MTRVFAGRDDRGEEERASGQAGGYDGTWSRMNTHLAAVNTFDLDFLDLLCDRSNRSMLIFDLLFNLQSLRTNAGRTEICAIYRLKKETKIENFYVVIDGWEFWVSRFRRRKATRRALPPCYLRPRYNGWNCWSNRRNSDIVSLLSDHWLLESYHFWS